MALGTVTVVKGAGRGVANVFFDEITVVGDASYQAGGSAFDTLFKTAVGAGRTILTVLPVDAKGYQPAYDSENGKLILYQGNNDAGADGPAVEVANDTVLSGVTFKFLVLST
jgi:hypothetical protein